MFCQITCHCLAKCCWWCIQSSHGGIHKDLGLGQWENSQQSGLVVKSWVVQRMMIRPVAGWSFHPQGDSLPSEVLRKFGLPYLLPNLVSHGTEHQVLGVKEADPLPEVTSSGRTSQGLMVLTIASPSNVTISIWPSRRSQLLWGLVPPYAHTTSVQVISGSLCSWTSNYLAKCP
jgi:hypothetical protein